MRCKKCNSVNRACASYCKNCGSKFTEKERNQAKNKTIEGVIVQALELVDKMKSILDLSIITGKTWFKVFSVIFVLGIGFYSCFQNGGHIRILTNDSYQINYNKKLKEYYLLVNDKDAKLKLYIPFRNQDVVVKHMENEKELESKKYQDGSDIVLASNQEQDYYLIIGKNLLQQKESLKVYIYKGELSSDESK